MKSKTTKLVFLLLIILLVLLLQKYNTVETFNVSFTEDVSYSMTNIITDVSNMSKNVYDNFVDISDTIYEFI